MGVRALVVAMSMLPSQASMRAKALDSSRIDDGDIHEGALPARRQGSHTSLGLVEGDVLVTSGVRLVLGGDSAVGWPMRGCLPSERGCAKAMRA
jgi:hypothetical protein